MVTVLLMVVHIVGVVAVSQSSQVLYPCWGLYHGWLLGDEQEPSQSQINAIILLMAWIADLYEIPPSQIHGHRDFIPVNKKGEHIDPRTNQRITCPGDNLYRYLADKTIQHGVARLLEPKHNVHSEQRPK